MSTLRDELLAEEEPVHIQLGLPTCRHCGHHVRYHMEDGLCDPCMGPVVLGPPSPEKVRDIYLSLARANAERVLEIINLRPGWYWKGTEDDAAWHARLTYGACLKHQLYGGHPEDSGGE